MSSLVVPNIECVESTENFGRFRAEPLEKGVGVTLGNSLRRVLLGYLPGAAVTRIRIDGIQHEFSVIPYAKEDVMEFLLNVKALRLKPISGRVGKMTLAIDLARALNCEADEPPCGKCPPCRIGTKRMLEILERITGGKGEEGDIEKLEVLARNIKASALCGLGQTAPNPVLSTLKYFRSEYEAHVRDRKCPAGVCKSMMHYMINADRCKSCGICARNCPVGCISGDKKTPYVIDQEKCIKCGTCMEKCPFKAIFNNA